MGLQVVEVGNDIAELFGVPLLLFLLIRLHRLVLLMLLILRVSSIVSNLGGLHQGLCVLLEFLLGLLDELELLSADLALLLD